MKQLSIKGHGLLLGVVMCLALAMTLPATGVAQSEAPAQIAGVDNTRMGAYRALAQLSFQAFHKGDNATAATLARILERTWDNGEGGGGEKSLRKTNPDLFAQIDKAMDDFMHPLIHYPSDTVTKTPDPALVQAEYNNYLDKLKLAD
jgi:hypothetical protein